MRKFFLTWIILISSFFFAKDVAQAFNCGDVVTYSGINYPTVQIGTQCWFGKNLNIGTLINYSSSQGNADAGTIEKYCYNNVEANCTSYGALYQWHTALKFSSTCDNNRPVAPCLPNSLHQGICPTGWHIPSQSDFNNLITAAGGSTLAGGNLKQMGITSWSLPNTGAVDAYNFTALGTGYTIRRIWKNYNQSTYYWSSTFVNKKRASSLALNYNTAATTLGGIDKTTAVPVRCIYDFAFIDYSATYNLKYTAGTGGSLVGTTLQTVSYGNSGTSVTAVANTLYAFASWSDGRTDNPRIDSNVTANVNVTANFSYTGVDNTAPTAPGSLTLSSVGYNSAVLNLGVASVDDFFSEYIVYYKIGSSGVDDTDSVINFQSIPALAYANYGGATDITVPGLLPNTQYDVTIYAYDQSGNSRAASKDVTFTTGSDTVSPSTPGSFTTVFAGPNSVGLMLGATSSDAFFQSYKIFYKVGSSAVTESDIEINSTVLPFLNYPNYNNTNFFRLDNLLSNTQYVFNIWAYDYYGNKSHALSEATVTTQSSNVVKAAKQNIKYTLLDSSVANSTTSTVKLKKNVGYTKTTSITDPAVMQIPVDATLIFKDTNNIVTTTDATTLTVDGNVNTANFPVIPLGALSAGISNRRISSDANITLNLDMSGVPDFTYIEIYTKEAGDISWSRLLLDGEAVSCITWAETCQFQTKHLSDFGGGEPMYTATYIAGTNGSISGSSTQKITIGNNATSVTAVPNSGYRFYQWSDGSTSNPRTDVNISGDITVTASFVDNTAPTNPGAMTLSSIQKTSVTLNLGASSTDAHGNFLEYKIFYKSGSSGVTESDTAITSSTLAGLAASNYGGISSFSISGLTPNTQYVANIWAYDAYANKSYAVSEVTFTTIDATPPDVPGILKPIYVNQTSVGFQLSSPAKSKNFSHYKIFYKSGSSGVTDEDNEYNSSQNQILGSMNISSDTIITLENLSPNTLYTMNIWAYDKNGNFSNSLESNFRTQSQNSFKVIKKNIDDVVSDSSVTEVVSGYGNSILNAQRISLKKELNVVRTESLEDSPTINIPVNTTLTAYNSEDTEVAANFSLISLSTGTDTSDLKGVKRGAISFGFSDKRITADQPITISLDTFGVADGTILDVYSKESGASDWSVLYLDSQPVVCIVVNNVCQFQTKHLSDFAAVSASGSSGVPEFSPFIYFFVMSGLCAFLLHNQKNYLIQMN